MEKKQPTLKNNNSEEKKGDAYQKKQEPQECKADPHETEKEMEKVVVAAADEEENASISDEIDCFLAILMSLKDDDDKDRTLSPPQLPPDPVINKFLSKVDADLSKYESDSADKLWAVALLDGIDRVARLSTALSAFSSTEADYKNTAERTGRVLKRAMSFLEEEFRQLLEDSTSKAKASPQQTQCHDSDSCTLPRPPPPEAEANIESDRDGNPPLYPAETIDRLRRIADVMISAGYESGCCQAFSIARHNAFESGLSNLGFRRISNDDVQKMQWESLEVEIVTWIQAFRQSITVSFVRERNLCESVFSQQHRAIAGSLFNNLVRGVLIQMLNFAEAIAATKVSAEKLFKFLDMYEALRDMLPEMDALFPGEQEAIDLKSEISSARARLGEAAVAIFSDLESSIKVDVSKIPVPGGAVHPLTRYVMNYLKYACEYIRTLEQIFAENQRNEAKSPPSSEHTWLAKQLIGVMDLLDSNIESKSKLYKELALSYIFLMNNGRYIVKKIKESTEIYQLVGDNFYRKRSGDLRQYHKNYQRETWAKVLACFKDEGFMVKGSVSKLALKEKMKSFNTMLEEIHKSQSNWVVSDEQLKSELRVSITAVLVPAYRSFLSKYNQNLNGKQAEKNIKFAPDDIETKIDELFEGNPSSHGKKR